MRFVLRGALLLCALSTALPALADVFINELHYDTPGSTDANETVEVVATGGEDLANYRIQLYNGSGGAPYGSVVTLPSGANVTCGNQVRITTYNFTANGGQIQNGAPDGLALIGPSDVVVQFLSYEGQMTAVGGFADGLLSQDIGVSEDSAGNLGESLQLAGNNGLAYSDFNWQGEASATFGACNNGQTFGTPVDNPPQLTASTPANAATDVAVGGNIGLTFSEAVTTTDPWFVLNCGAGNVAGVLSGSGNARSFNPDADLPFAASCTVTLTAANIHDTDGTLDPLTGTTTFSFTTVADLPPTLSSSTPSAGSTTFPANGNLQLQFSEPVAVGSNWFTIVCSTSGTRNVADTVVSGGPTSFTINPNSDFAQGESCSLNFNAAQISDLDGALDAYAGVAMIAFTPAAPVVNQLPVVLSTTPMNGDSNFPAAGDIVVLFSEPVTLTAGAFAITCATTSNIALTHAGSGTSFTVSLDKVLVGGEACSFSIDRTKVTDADGAVPALDTAVNFTVATGSAGTYYTQVNIDGDPQQLRCSLHEVIDGHTVYPYSAGTTDTWDVLELADQAPGAGNENFILDAYRNELYPRAGGGNTNYNREHTWPNSLGFANTALAAYTDTHMLYLTNIGYNSDRGNSPYKNCSSCTERVTVLNFGFGGGSGSYPGNSNWFDANGFEVWAHRRGDMARAIMYMAIRYEGKADDEANDGDIPDLELTDNEGLIAMTSNKAAKAYMGLMTTLLQWHQLDPPDAAEITRNGVVQSFQGNRNPFIDHPEWGTSTLFTSTQPSTCTMGSGNVAPTADDDSYNANEDTLLTVITANGVLVGDTDPESAPLTASLLATVQHGVLALASDGSFSYTPSSNYCGDDSFTYRAHDGSNYSAAAVVDITIACSNDPPNAVGTLANQTYLAGAVVSLGTASGFADIDGDTLTYTATGLPASLAIGLNDGIIGGTVQASDIGVHNVVVTARDPSLAQATQSFTITVTALPAAIFGDGFE